MVSGRDLEITDLAESIPYVLGRAMRGDEQNVVRGLCGLSGGIMWNPIFPAIRLTERIYEAKQRDEKIYPREIEEILNSARYNEIIGDFEQIGLIEPDKDDLGNFVFKATDIWDTFDKSMSNAPLHIGFKSLGTLLGLCSLARHFGRRCQVGLSTYIPAKTLAIEAIRRGDRIPEADAKEVFTRHSGSQKHWLNFKYEDRERHEGLGFFSDWSDPLILNPNTRIATERVITRTQDLIRERGLTV